MIKGLIIAAFGLGIFGTGAATSVKDYMPHAVELTTGPVAFKASLAGITTSVPESSELALIVHSKSAQLIKISF